MKWIALALCVVSAVPSPALADTPPGELLDALFPVLRGKNPLGPKTTVTFQKKEAPDNAACGLARIDLVRTREDETQSFQLLGEPVSGADAAPKAILIRLKRMTVNADGSRRAYHPDDPFGRNCQPADDPDQKICAVDYLSNAEIRVFERATRIRQFIKNPADGPPLPNPAFATAWASLWKDIAARKDRWVDLRAIFGDDAPDELRLYYSQDTDRAVLFNSDIIPFDKSYPCQYRDKRDEFFVAATAPHRAPPAQLGQTCRTAAYLDSLRVPFFVLPSGIFRHLRVGDAAIARVMIGASERLVYGIVGDAGPSDQIGEGSIAFLQRVQGTNRVIKNSLDTGELDIKLEPPTDIASLSVLVLGGTADALGLDYSPANIDKVARAALARWSEGKPERLRACSALAPENPLHGTAGTVPPH